MDHSIPEREPPVGLRQFVHYSSGAFDSLELASGALHLGTERAFARTQALVVELALHVSATITLGKDGSERVGLTRGRVLLLNMTFAVVTAVVETAKHDDGPSLRFVLTPAARPLQPGGRVTLSLDRVPPRAWCVQRLVVDRGQAA